MASVLALISKAVFENLIREPDYRIGDVIPLDRYTSKHAAFAQLDDDDAIFLVTVRPKGLLLVAILEQPKRRGEALIGTTNTAPLAFITDRLSKLQLADGKGISVGLDKLGMSLQTPRVLAPDDVALLRRGTSTGKHVSTATPAKMKLEKKTSRASKDAPTVKLHAGELSSRAKALLKQVYAAPRDRSLRTVFADQLLEDQHVWGELISLQLSDPKRHAERIRKIIHQHARMIVGAIANVAARDCLTITDGFLSVAQCAKSSSFTSGPERHEAAIAPEWATVETVIFTPEMTNVFIREVLHNPAASNLTKVIKGHKWDPKRRYTALERARPGDPWRIVEPSESVLDGLEEKELARIPIPRGASERAALEAAQQRREKVKTRRAR